jgi:sec-independent protein translocase protein TatA
MHAPSLWTALILLGLAFLLFGKPGRLSSTMEDLGKGIRGFRKGLTEGEKPPEATPPKPEDPPKLITDNTQVGDKSASERENSGA